MIDPLCKDGNSRFTTEPLKTLSVDRGLKYPSPLLPRIPVNLKCTLAYSVKSAQLTLLVPFENTEFFYSDIIK